MRDAPIKRLAVFADDQGAHLVLLCPEEPLNADTAPGFGELFERLERDYRPRAVIIDLGGSLMPASAWLGVLVVAVHHAREDGRSVFLADVAPETRTVLRLIGIADFVDLADTVESAQAEAHRRHFPSTYRRLKIVHDTAPRRP